MQNPSSSQPPAVGRARSFAHAAAVVLAFSAIFIWAYWRAIADQVYLAQSDLFEYFLPIFLSPRIVWSTFEFSGIPVFADPGESTAYPVHVLFAKVFGSWAGFAVAAHVIGASGAYAYVYSLTRSKTASFLSGLAFGLSEVMVERIAHIGVLHAIAWMPLVFLAIERLLATGSRRWVGLGGVIVAMVILSGHPQPAIYACLAAGVYALAGGRAGRKPRRYYAGITAIFLLGGLLSAIKLLPFAQVLRYLARDEMNFGQFLSSANTPAQMWSALFPTVLHDGRETPTYVGLLMLVFAGVGATRARVEWRARFWVLAILFCVLIALGDATPVAKIAYDYLPTYNRFRVGARHLIVACLGAVVLAGLGIDAVQRGGATRRLTLSLASVAALMAIALVYFHGPHAGVAFENRIPIPWSDHGLPAFVPNQIWTQVAIALATFVACAGFGLATRKARWVPLMVVVLGVDLLNAQPFAVSMRGLDSVLIPTSAAKPSVHVEQVIRELAPTHQRFLAIGGTMNDQLIPATWARLWRVPIAGGYGPMLLERHSRLSTMGRNGAVRPWTLTFADQSLNLLAVKYIGVQEADVESKGTFKTGNLVWEKGPFDLTVGRDDCNHAYKKVLSLPLPADMDIAAVDVVGYLRCSESVPQGDAVATMTLVGTDGQTYAQTLRAGVDLAEIGLADASVLARAKHSPINNFEDPDRGTRARVTLRLPAPARLSRLDVEVPPFNGWLTIERMTVTDATGHGWPRILQETLLADTRRWRKLRTFRTERTTDRGQDTDSIGESPYTLYENLKALPRAWVATQVEAMDAKDVLATIRNSQFPDGRAFDPATDVLVEKDTPMPPRASFTGSRGSARIGLEDNGRWELEVTSEGGGVLVLSETNYPGWNATIDGASTEIYTADVSLMGIVVPAGTHQVVFSFAPFTLLAGTAVSVLALIVTLLLVAVPAI